MAAWLAGGAVAHAVASPESRQWPREIATSERPHISRVEASRASSTERCANESAPTLGPIVALPVRCFEAASLPLTPGPVSRLELERKKQIVVTAYKLYNVY
jgi:hypothetical protein